MSTKYINLAKTGTEYARRINHLSNRIFGEVCRPMMANSKSMRVVKMFSEEPIYKRSDVIKYYPKHNETHYLMKQLRLYGLFRDEHADFREEMRRLRALRGKAPPKKGEGKRAAASSKKS